jgi:hypothetical protein
MHRMQPSRTFPIGFAVVLLLLLLSNPAAAVYIDPAKPIPEAKPRPQNHKSMGLAITLSVAPTGALTTFSSYLAANTEELWPSLATAAIGWSIAPSLGHVYLQDWKEAALFSSGRLSMTLLAYGLIFGAFDGILNRLPYVDRMINDSFFGDGEIFWAALLLSGTASLVVMEWIVTPKSVWRYNAEQEAKTSFYVSPAILAVPGLQQPAPHLGLTAGFAF